MRLRAYFTMLIFLRGFVMPDDARHLYVIMGVVAALARVSRVIIYFADASQLPLPLLPLSRLFSLICRRHLSLVLMPASPHLPTIDLFLLYFMPSCFV